MKITICGSSRFRHQMVEYMGKLQNLGHEVIVHEHYVKSVNGTMPELMERVEREHAALKREQNYIKWYHNAIQSSDAILVLNFDKNGIKNYVGGNTLMEIGFAHVNDKKVFYSIRFPRVCRMQMKSRQWQMLCWKEICKR